MAVQSHSFQGNVERTEKPEKICLVANPAKEQENTAGEFHQKRKDEKLKGGEHQRMEEGTGSHNLPLQRAGEWRSEDRDRPPASDRECRSRSRSVSTATRSSSVTSGSSGGRRGNRRNHGKGRSRRSRRSRSSSSSRSPSRSRPRPRCHRAPARSRCRRGGRRSPPRRYRARSRSYSPSHSPARRCRSGSPARARSRSTNRRARGVLAQSRFCLALSPERRSPTRSPSRSREPDGTGVHLSLPEKRQLLLASRESAVRARGGWEEVPAALEDPEGPVFAPRARPETSPRESHSQTEAEQDVPCSKMSLKNKISFSINNSVAKPVAGRSSSSPENTATVRSYYMTGRNPYGHWVPVKGRSHTKSR